MDGAEELAAGRPVGSPVLSIVIPTFRRPGLLQEAVACAVGQTFDRPFEVIVVDDDPASSSCDLLLSASPGFRDAPLRFLRNRRNRGMFDNINYGIAQARGEWITILHDDDLLHLDWARAMFAVLEARPEIDGLICRKRCLDQRDAPVRDGRLKTLARRGVQLLRFGLRDTRRIGARKLFWECIGNTVGFVCRKRDLLAAGGFRAEEHPSSDYSFYLRFGARFRFAEFRRVLGTIRIADNSLLGRDVLVGATRRNHEAQHACLAAGAPAWWRRLIPLVTARQIAAASRFYEVPIAPAEVGRLLGIRIPRDRPVLLNLIRAAYGGF